MKSKEAKVLLLLIAIFFLIVNMPIASCVPGSDQKSGARASIKIDNLKDVLPGTSLDKKTSRRAPLIYLAVIGGGPAGLSAGLYGARAGVHTVIFRGPKPGGQLIDGILVENWPGVDKGSGANVVEKLENQVKSFGAYLIQDTIKKVDFSSWPFKLWGQKEIYNALSVIIATGAIPRRLHIAGESKYWIKGGILPCALCDAHLAKNEDVVIIGGGDATIERILQLAPFASSIKVIVRSNKLRASKRMKRKIKELKNIEILYNKQVKEFVGDGNSLMGVNVYDNISKVEKFIPAKWAFLAIGFEPNSNLFKGQLPMTENGYIKHDGLQSTFIQGVYTAGNVSDDKYRQASTASGDATKAALNAVNFLNSLEIGARPDLKKQLRGSLFVQNIQSANNSRGVPAFQVDSIKTDIELTRILKSSKKPILLYFFSPLCSTCKAMETVIKQFAYELKNGGARPKLSVYKIDISRSLSLSKKFNIKSVPTYTLLLNGKKIKQIVGQKTKEQLIKFVEECSPR